MTSQQPKFRHTLIRRTGIALLAVSLVIRNPLDLTPEQQQNDTYISDACSGRWSEPCADIHDPAYERLTDALIEVFELMDAIAPLGCYFGSSEGDGACIGFWEIETDEE
jgi:hypothetical protein